MSDQRDWGMRADGTPKGTGYLGVLVRPDGGISSELSMGTTDVTGKETEIPLLVPTLTKDEVRYLLAAQAGDWQHPTMKRIAAKATEFARLRLKQGQPFFASPGEEYPLYPDLPRAAVQQMNGDVQLPNTSGQRDPRLASLTTLGEIGKRPR